jgi:hypothetical protein
MKSGPFAALLAVQLLALTPLGAQPANGLLVAVVDGEGVIHNLRRSAPRDVAVRVGDEQGRPVADAVVAFTLPAQGAGGSFPKGAATTIVHTNASGLAVVHGLRSNQVPGKFEIVAVASSQGRTARATITQFNMEVRQAERKASGRKIAAIVAILAAGAAAGAYAGLHQGGPSAPVAPPPIPPISITAGTGSVGVPH